jgi:hypothetical protein
MFSLCVCACVRVCGYLAAHSQEGEVLTRFPAGLGQPALRRLFVANDTANTATLGVCDPNKHELHKDIMMALQDIKYIFVGKASKSFDREGDEPRAAARDVRTDARAHSTTETRTH